ncbi:MAG TPA: hypothetical protein VL201_03395 [Patescibacteria group bacterium]|nr:hypothetical protein [Patescibacteria group bacterium]
MPRNVVDTGMISCVVFALLLSMIWVQMIFKKNAAESHAHTLDTLKINTIYEKCRWIFLGKDLQLIMQTLAHISYKEQLACLKAYMDDKAVSDFQLKTVILFKTAMLHKKKGKKIHILNILPEHFREKQLLLKVAANDCSDIIPILYTWIKTHTEDYAHQQVVGAYNYAIQQNNPLLFNCLLEHDIPLQANQASAYLNTVLNEQKHKAFICLLVKAGAKMVPQPMTNSPINPPLLALHDLKNIFYRHLPSALHAQKDFLNSTYS